MCLQTRIAQLISVDKKEHRPAEVMPMNARPTHILMDKLIHPTMPCTYLSLGFQIIPSKRVQGTLHKYIEVNNVVHSFPASRVKITPIGNLYQHTDKLEYTAALTVFERSHRSDLLENSFPFDFSEYNLLHIPGLHSHH